jgi:hypothetical protein
MRSGIIIHIIGKNAFFRLELKGMILKLFCLANNLNLHTSTVCHFIYFIAMANTDNDTTIR